jgi:hypothetical protein
LGILIKELYWVDSHLFWKKFPTFIVALLFLWNPLPGLIPYCYYKYKRPSAWHLFRDTCPCPHKNTISVVDEGFNKFKAHHFGKFEFDKLPTDSIYEIGMFLKVKDYLAFLSTSKAMWKLHYCERTKQCFQGGLKFSHYPKTLGSGDACNRIKVIKESVTYFDLKIVESFKRVHFDDHEYRFNGLLKNLRILKFSIPKSVLCGIETLEHLEELHIQDIQRTTCHSQFAFGGVYRWRWTDENLISLKFQDTTLKRKSNLKRLHFYGGGIRNMGKICKWFPNLEYLDLTNTMVKGGRIEPIFQTLKKLKHLTIESVMIEKKLCLLSECKSLRVLKLRNPLEDLPQEEIPPWINTLGCNLYPRWLPTL